MSKGTESDTSVCRVEGWKGNGTVPWVKAEDGLYVGDQGVSIVHIPTRQCRHLEALTLRTRKRAVFSFEPVPIIAQLSPSVTVHSTSRKTGAAEFGSPEW